MSEEKMTEPTPEELEALRSKAEEMSPMELIELVRRQFGTECYPKIGEVIQTFLEEHPAKGQIPVTEPAVWLQILIVNWLKATIPVTHYEFAAQTLTDGMRAQLGLEMIHVAKDEQN